MLQEREKTLSIQILLFLTNNSDKRRNTTTTTTTIKKKGIDFSFPSSACCSSLAIFNFLVE